MSGKIEKRYHSVEEIRTEDGERKIGGYAAVFNKEARISERLIEKIAPGAFRSSLGGDIRALWSHNPDMVIGRTTNGSLKLSEDERGLAFDLSLPDTTQGRDAYTLIKQGFVTGVSFGFRVKKDSWTRGDKDSPHLRTLEEVELIEVSPTAFPAYADTQVSSRSTDEVLKEKETEWAYSSKEHEERLIALRHKLDIAVMRFKLSDILLQ
jgi:HK97 family phage prohead protease